MRPRVAWLLETRAPSGAAMMAMRRMRVLRHRQTGTALAMSASPRRIPPGSPLAAVGPASALAGELRLARADVVVTTSELTLAAATPRLAAGRLVHFLHTRPELALGSEQFMRRVPVITRLVVPAGVDPAAFAAAAGLRREQVSAMDDFVLPRESLLGSARAKVALAIGRLDADTAVLDLVEAFRLALPMLAGWQLRIAGGGPGLTRLRDHVDRHCLGDRVLVLGPRYDLARLYLDAGLVVRIERSDANGLSVLEALAAGVPVLGSEAVPAVRRYVRTGVNGWVLARSDPFAIADALVLLAEDERRASLAADARSAQPGLLTDADRTALLDLFDAVLDDRPVARSST